VTLDVYPTVLEILMHLGLAPKSYLVFPIPPLLNVPWLRNALQ